MTIAKSLSTISETQSYPQEPLCRMCLDSTRPLVRICQCSGSIRYVHQQCVSNWICEILDQEHAFDDFENYDTPCCQLCQCQFSTNLTLEQEQLCDDHFIQYYNIKTSSHKLYVVFLIMFVVAVPYFVLSGMWTLYNEEVEFDPEIMFTHMMFPLFFGCHAVTTLKKDCQEMGKLCKRYILIQLQPEEVLE